MENESPTSIRLFSGKIELRAASSPPLEARVGADLK
jgi:hypothetical protein